MAIYSCHAGVFTRSKGHAAIAAAAYRAGVKLFDPTYAKSEDYQWKQHGVLYSEIMVPENAPAWMQDRPRLWSAVEAQEKRVDSQLAREMLVALPHELTAPQQIALIRRFVGEEFVARGMVADFSIHAPSATGDARNFHCHILLTMRPVDGDGFAAKKDRSWNQKELLAHWREAWADHANDALEEAGSDARIDHRSLEAQGVDRAAGLHMGKHATHAERKGRATDRGERQRAIEKFNDELAAMERDDDWAAMEAEIIAEEERRLDEAYGFPDPDHDPERDAWDEAEADIYEAAAQFGIEELSFDPPERPQASSTLSPPPWLGAARDAAAAFAQVCAAALPFGLAIGQWDRVADIVSDLVADGRAWWERATHPLVERGRELRDQLRSWRDQVGERTHRAPDEDRDLDR